MTLHLYVTTVIFVFLLIFASYVIYLGIFSTDHFNYIIFNRVQLLKYIGFVGIFVIFCTYIFQVRLNRVGLSINLYELALNFYEIMHFQSWTTLFLLSLLLSLFLIFLFLLLKLFYLNLRRRLLALYVYFFQYSIFQKLCFSVVDLQLYSIIYLNRRVMLFTENNIIFIISNIIWPGLLYNFEPRLIKVILPYLIVFDIFTQDWIISKVFVVLPWYYLYIIIRQTFLGISMLFKQENIDISQQLYQKFEVDGKIIRWVNLMPLPEDFKNKINT